MLPPWQASISRRAAAFRDEPRTVGEQEYQSQFGRVEVKRRLRRGDARVTDHDE